MFRNFIDKLTVVSNLHYLGIALDVQTLDKHNKELLKRLAQRAGNFVVKTMALICMTYKIYDAKYWEFVVNGAIKFSMVRASGAPCSIYLFGSSSPISSPTSISSTTSTTSSRAST